MTREERTAAQRAAREARRNRPRRRPSVALVAGCIGALALFFLPTLVGLRVQGIQRSYYDGIAARALAHHPIFTDSLARPDSFWPVKSPDAAHDPSDVYSGGAYQITGGPAANTVNATLSASYGDAAVQVTARQSGSSEYNGVGLVVRDVGSGPTESFVAFWVRPDGSWALEYCHSDAANPDGTWTSLASSDDASSASPVHTGLGAANTLLLITRGDEIIGYINGQWVAAARDNGIPATGGVGVYLEDGANTGIFSDFAIYQVSPAA